MARIRVWTCGAVLTGAAAGAALGEPRDVHIRSVNLDTRIIELHNYGSGAEDLSGWQFCTHNTTSTLNYSSTLMISGVTLNPGDSLFVHLNGDAGGLPGHINASGRFAAMIPDAYSIGLYWPNGGFISFASTDDLVDYVQWSLGGVHDATAAIRLSTAEQAGLWVRNGDGSVGWVALGSATRAIRLLDTSNGRAHGAADYEVLIDYTDCNSNFVYDPLDLVDGFLDANGNGVLDACEQCPCEFTGGAPVDVFDLLAYLDLWFAGADGAEFTNDAPASIDVFDLLAFLDCWFPASAGSPCAP